MAHTLASWLLFIKSSLNCSMFRVRMLELQFWQIGRRLSIVSSPPHASLTTCPQWKLSWDMNVTLQHQHRARPISSPMYVCHTSRRRAAGIARLLPILLSSSLARISKLENHALKLATI